MQSAVNKGVAVQEDLSELLRPEKGATSQARGGTSVTYPEESP